MFFTDEVEADYERLRARGAEFTRTIRESFEKFAAAAGVTRADYLARIENMTHLRRLTTLEELGNAATFLASDQASAMTGMVANLSGGAVVD